ncbi:MAG: cytochrome b [Alphaproteobacteria bacterium]|nr:cytochrome b [Alphaproteobacteria bacterium]MDD9919668.1 cytochrome b [Alphaproteobacteria bacterium]
MLKNTRASWGAVAQFFHWFIMVLFLAMYIIAEQMEDLLPVGEQFLGFGKWELYGLHKSTGVLILALVAIRFFWRLVNVTPREDGQMTKLQTKAAEMVHLGLYAVMFGMPISGYVMSMAGGHGITVYGLFKMPDLIGRNKPLAEFAHGAHEFIWNVFVFLVAVHVLAALYHHFVKKDTVLRRMLPGG